VFAGSRGALDMADDRVTPLMLDVTNVSQIRRAVEAVDTLDVLINKSLSRRPSLPDQDHRARPINGSLRSLIATGAGRPNPKE
jgi:hypothetical protein